MRRVTWRNLFARKIRLALSGFAIVLGVAFVAGSFIFTDALGGAFNGIIKGTTADVEIQPKGAGGFDANADNRTIPRSALDTVAKIPGVAAAHGSVEVDNVFVIGKNKKLVGGNGPPGFAFNYGDTKAITGNQIITITDGQVPHGTGEIALDVDTADKAGYKIGDTVTLVTPGKPPLTTAKLVGLVRFGSNGGLVGATLTIYDTKAIQQLYFGGRDVYTELSLTAAQGHSQRELADAANQVLPKGITAKRGDKVAKDNQKIIGRALGFINTFLLVFAAVAMIVGTFLIINTFSILVAQRSRELALLRALGASKRQVNRAVLAEAAVVGFVASTVGIAAGYLLALGLKSLFGRFGLDIGNASFPLRPRTIIVSYIVGLVVTLIAAYLPARHASRISPVAAMRDEVALPETSLRRRVIIGTVLIALGVASMALGFAGSGSSALLMIGLGMLSILIGVSLLAPMIGRPVIRALGFVYVKLFKTVGLLARENSLRNPRRTAATASALMIGLALVALMSILGQSTNASTDKAINQTLTADFVVSNAVGGSFSPAVGDEIEKLNGIETVARFRQANGKVDGKDAFLGAADPSTLGAGLRLQMAAGGLSGLTPKTILVDKRTAKGRQYQVGDTVRLKLQGGTQRLRVGGIFTASAALPANYIVTFQTLVRGGVKPADSLLYIRADPSADLTQIHDEINAITKDLPTVTLKDQQQFADEQKKQVNTLLYLIYALLGLAVIIAVLGIVNTLALSVIERVHEVGLLRAVGMARRQLRWMVLLESVAIAVLGAVLGIVIGIGFGIALQRAIADEGIDVLSIPWAQFLVFVLLAALVGMLAAVLPARRAAKLDVLAAITTE
jgi:putative ABC transport system permease protein